MLEDGASFIGYLTTVGRVTGRKHKVALRLVYYQGRLYASRRDTSSDWCQNLIKDPGVLVELPNHQIHGNARIIDDDKLAETIFGLKYRDDRASRKRVLVEIVPIHKLD